MSAFDDYHLCPAVDRWLPPRLPDGAASWTTLSRLPRVVRRLVDSLARNPAATTGLVVVARLDEPVDAVPASVLDPLEPGALVVDICLPPRRRAVEWVSAPARSRRVQTMTAARLSGWLVRGLHDVDQWVSVDPVDAVVTTGRLRR